MLQQIKDLVYILLAIFGYRLDHATLPRTIVMGASLVSSYYLTEYQGLNSPLALWYFFISSALYIGFLFLTLPEHGLRVWLIKTYGEEGGYRTFEAIVACLFYHNGTSIGFVAITTPGSASFLPSNDVVLPIAAVLFVAGFLIKMWAAKVVSIDIYYWKDMFLGRKTCEFVVSGPYKFLKNPMYGLGQMQSYGIALRHRSLYGLAIAVFNQCAIFTFYFLAEQKFIERIYLAKKPEMPAGKRPKAGAF
jgi:protein-S-isoprenylcysteine O-methyltransferase Ste14